MCAAGLIVDAVVYLQLAADYQLAAPARIGQGNLVPDFGPIPSMSESEWLAKETLSAVAASVAAVAAVAAVLGALTVGQSDSLSGSEHRFGLFHRRGSSPPALFKEEV
ncbi:MAG: hypothetical protein ABJA34_10645 [Pseudonocardiales bacterium]